MTYFILYAINKQKLIKTKNQTWTQSQLFSVNDILSQMVRFRDFKDYMFFSDFFFVGLKCLKIAHVLSCLRFVVHGKKNGHHEPEPGQKVSASVRQTDCQVGGGAQVPDVRVQLWRQRHQLHGLLPLFVPHGHQYWICEYNSHLFNLKNYSFVDIELSI